MPIRTPPFDLGCRSGRRQRPGHLGHIGGIGRPRGAQIATSAVWRGPPGPISVLRLPEIRLPESADTTLGLEILDRPQPQIRVGLGHPEADRRLQDPDLGHERRPLGHICPGGCPGSIDNEVDRRSGPGRGLRAAGDDREDDTHRPIEPGDERSHGPITPEHDDSGHRSRVGPSRQLDDVDGLGDPEAHPGHRPGGRDPPGQLRTRPRSIASHLSPRGIRTATGCTVVAGGTRTVISDHRQPITGDRSPATDRGRPRRGAPGCQDKTGRPPR